MAQRSAERNKAELLAPAGSFEGLKLAVNAGADAVYFGTGKFHARRAAKPFSVEEAVRYCHIFGVKAYLALNVIVKENELSEIESVISEAYRAGIDAFIVTDLGLIESLRIYAPKVPLHASTQLGVATKEGAEFLKSLGFSRIVLAREAGIEEIKAIKSIGIEVEYFVHGALCVAFSGSCLMSSIKSGESGNRGLCKQPCRLPYRLITEGKATRVSDTAYFLSPKDQCLLSRLDELRAAGVDSFKIEGRLKRDIYPCGVTKVYRRVLDVKKPDERDYKTLKRIYNRGEFFEGYAFSKRCEAMSPKVQSNLGITVGKFEEVRQGKAYFKSSEPLKSIDGFKILRNGREADVRIGKVFLCEDGRYRIEGENLRVGDEIRLTDDADFNQKILSTERKIPLSIRAVCLKNRPIVLEISTHEIIVRKEGEAAVAAINNPASAEEIKAQLTKLGGTAFRADSVGILTDGIFLKKSVMNELRRSAIEALENALLEKNSPKRSEIEKNFDVKNVPKKHCVFAEVDSLEKAFNVPNQDDIVIVYRADDDAVRVVTEFVSDFRNKRQKQKLLLYTPPMLLNRDAERLKQTISLFDGIVANSLCAVKIALESKKFILAGLNLNIANKKNPLIELSNAYLVSAELNASEVKPFADGVFYAYGRLPLMYLNHCPQETENKNCNNCDRSDKLCLDDGKYRFPLRRFVAGGVCRYRVLNAVNTDLGECVRGKSVYLDFSETEADHISEIVREYTAGTRVSAGNYTLMHWKRGVL